MLVIFSQHDLGISKNTWYFESVKYLLFNKIQHQRLFLCVLFLHIWKSAGRQFSVGGWMVLFCLFPLPTQCFLWSLVGVCGCSVLLKMEASGFDLEPVLFCRALLGIYSWNHALGGWAVGEFPGVFLAQVLDFGAVFLLSEQEGAQLRVHPQLWWLQPGLGRGNAFPVTPWEGRAAGRGGSTWQIPGQIQLVLCWWLLGLCTSALLG